MKTHVSIHDLIFSIIEADVKEPRLDVIDDLVANTKRMLHAAPLLHQLIEDHGDLTTARRRFNATDSVLTETLRPLLVDMYWQA